LRKNLGIIGITQRAHPGNFCWSMEQGVGDLASDHIGFIAIGDSENHIRIFSPCPRQHTGVCRLPLHGAYIKPILYLSQQLGILIYNGNVIGFRSQIVCHRGADLTRTQNDYFHLFILPVEALLTANTALIGLSGSFHPLVQGRILLPSVFNLNS